ncbi:MAG TPA: protein kinase [Polyangiaceae bacterium]
MSEYGPESAPLTHKVSDVGRYRLIAELARGGMGIVYLALVRGPGGFNKLFCVKVLRGQMSEDRKLVTMFLEEARLAAKLNHPNVVQTIEVGSDAGQHYIAMEYLEGQSLHSIQVRGRRADHPLSLAYQLHVLVHLLEGLQYAHSAADFDGTPLRLVHRDVSPHNVLVTYEGQVKILDFGIAKALGSSNDTNTGMLKGKIAYMAPEQAAGEPLDGRADVFSAGVMLWEAAVGQRMWPRSLNDLQILHALMKGAIPDPREAKPDLDARLERIIRRAIAVRVGDRYESAAAMQHDVEAYLKEMQVPSFGARDIGKLVGEAFEEDRAHIRSVIEAQLGLLRGAASGQFATIDLPLLSSGHVGSGTPSGVLMTAEQLERPTLIEGLRSSSGVHGTLARGDAAKARRSPIAKIVVVVGIAVLATAGVALSLRHPAPAVAPPEPTPQAASSPARVSVPPPASTSAPVAASASAANVVDAAAPGPHEEPTASSAPRVVTYPRATVRSLPVAAPTAAPTVPTASPPQPSSTAHVRQQIDTSNPYGH